MKKVEFNAIEKEMMNFNFDELTARNSTAKENIANAKSVGDIKAEICSVWSKIRKYVIWAENVPVAGKFISILAELLDAICGA